MAIFEEIDELALNCSDSNPCRDYSQIALCCVFKFAANTSYATRKNVILRIRSCVSI